MLWCLKDSVAPIKTRSRKSKIENSAPAFEYREDDARWVGGGWCGTDLKDGFLEDARLTQLLHTQPYLNIANALQSPPDSTQLDVHFSTTSLPPRAEHGPWELG